MRRTLILAAAGTITLFTGLAVGTTLATASPVQPTPAAAGCPMADMTGMEGMTNMMQMMGSSAMGGAMPAGNTDHAAHHQGILP